MALPVHLQHYDTMIDLIVESLVREVTGEITQTNAPDAGGTTFPAGARFDDAIRIISPIT